MTDHRNDAAHDLSVLIDVAQRLGETFELGPLLKTIEQAGLAALDCERASVFLYDPKREELYSKVATGTDEIRFPVRLGIAGEAARTRAVIHVPDAYADPRFNQEIDRRTGYRTRNMLTVPMAAPDGKLMGVLQVLNKRAGAFGPDDERLAAALGSLTGIAIKRQMLMDEAAVKLRLERELDIARQIQQKLIPGTNPRPPGFEVAGWNRPAESTGGDFYDFFAVGADRLALVVADATGHGIGPALIMAQCRALLRAVSESCTEPSGAAARVNNLLCGDLPCDRFVTLFYGLLDIHGRRIDYVSAGHGPMLHLKAASGEIARLGSTGLPMGIVEDAEMPCGEPIEMAPGDIFVVLTDGFVEWADAQGQQYGEDRIADLLRRNRGETPERLIELLCADVEAFSGGTTQQDDLTAVVVKRTEN
jgi:phosphoserine phosphatase